MNDKAREARPEWARWNFTATDEALLVCKDLHDKGDDCEYEAMHPEAVLKLVEELRSAALQWAASQQAVPEGWRTLAESKPTHDEQLCAVEVEHGGDLEVWPARWSERYQNFPAGLGWFEASEVRRWQPLPTSITAQGERDEQ